MAWAMPWSRVRSWRLGWVHRQRRGIEGLWAAVWLEPLLSLGYDGCVCCAHHVLTDVPPINCGACRLGSLGATPLCRSWQPPSSLLHHAHREQLQPGLAITIRYAASFTNTAVRTTVPDVCLYQPSAGPTHEQPSHTCTPPAPAIPPLAQGPITRVVVVGIDPDSHGAIGVAFCDVRDLNGHAGALVQDMHVSRGSYHYYYYPSLCLRTSVFESIPTR